MTNVNDANKGIDYIISQRFGSLIYDSYRHRAKTNEEKRASVVEFLKHVNDVAESARTACATEVDEEPGIYRLTKTCTIEVHDDAFLEAFRLAQQMIELRQILKFICDATANGTVQVHPDLPSFDADLIIKVNDSLQKLENALTDSVSHTRREIDKTPTLPDTHQCSTEECIYGFEANAKAFCRLYYLSKTFELLLSGQEIPEDDQQRITLMRNQHEIYLPRFQCLPQEVTSQLETLQQIPVRRPVGSELTDLIFTFDDYDIEEARRQSEAILRVFAELQYPPEFPPNYNCSGNIGIGLNTSYESVDKFMDELYELRSWVRCAKDALLDVSLLKKHTYREIESILKTDEPETLTFEVILRQTQGARYVPHSRFSYKISQIIEITSALSKRFALLSDHESRCSIPARQEEINQILKLNPLLFLENPSLIPITTEDASSISLAISDAKQLLRKSYDFPHAFGAEIPSQDWLTMTILVESYEGLNYGRIRRLNSWLGDKAAFANEYWHLHIGPSELISHIDEMVAARKKLQQFSTQYPSSSPAVVVMNVYVKILQAQIDNFRELLPSISQESLYYATETKIATISAFKSSGKFFTQLNTICNIAKSLLQREEMYACEDNIPEFSYMSAEKATIRLFIHGDMLYYIQEEVEDSQFIILCNEIGEIVEYQTLTLEQINEYETRFRNELSLFAGKFSVVRKLEMLCNGGDDSFCREVDEYIEEIEELLKKQREKIMLLQQTMDHAEEQETLEANHTDDVEEVSEQEEVRNAGSAELENEIDSKQNDEQGGDKEKREEENLKTEHTDDVEKMSKQEQNEEEIRDANDSESKNEIDSKKNDEQNEDKKEEQEENLETEHDDVIEEVPEQKKVEDADSTELENEIDSNEQSDKQDEDKKEKQEENLETNHYDGVEEIPKQEENEEETKDTNSTEQDEDKEKREEESLEAQASKEVHSDSMIGKYNQLVIFLILHSFGFILVLLQIMPSDKVNSIKQSNALPKVPELSEPISSEEQKQYVKKPRSSNPERV
jgi:hypothetical protein